MENLTETQVTTDKIYSGCILDFYRDTVRLPNGGRSERDELARRDAGLLAQLAACGVIGRFVAAVALAGGDLRDGLALGYAQCRRNSPFFS